MITPQHDLYVPMASFIYIEKKCEAKLTRLKMVENLKKKKNPHGEFEPSFLKSSWRSPKIERIF